MNITNLTIFQLHKHYRGGDFTPTQLIHYLLDQAQMRADDSAWIYLLKREEVQGYLDNLNGRSPDELPLYGIPFAIKDNIDLAGIPTTAACEAFAYTPTESAFVVQRLLDAGAIPLGKTNLDQFATGLVGTRSPYGATKNAFDAQYISGGSSSGSAVVVAQGLASFSLGTDTAGSGRVPAGFNNILGLKPSRGLLSNRGVVPACKSLDCVAIFATTAADLQTLFDITAVYDPKDAHANRHPETNRRVHAVSAAFSFAVPQPDQLKFFGNTLYEKCFQQAITQLEQVGGRKHEIDFSPFIDAAKLLYEGPWVAERYLACQPLIDDKPQTLLEVTRKIIAAGKDKTAAQAFNAQYQLQAYKKLTDTLLTPYDFILTPTSGTIYTIEDVMHDPVHLNSNLGYYTNYMNLLDYCAIAVPTGFTDKGLPFGITLVANKFADQQLLAYAERIQQALGLNLGVTTWPLPAPAESKIARGDDQINLVVCGAHMSGLPLNPQLLERNATLVKQCKSAPHYQLLALPGGPPQRPGMIRVEEAGQAIEVEVWSIPREHVGSFLAGIPHPLGLGKVELEDGSWETGFICEGYIAQQAQNISAYGGWRAYIKSLG